ncbi:aminotransferase class V-fold PLP-dependent enzyme [Jiangella ureilytica]|uniref:Aminotransferase class V-fold PLP-dependent enzyme n=1 Tax=Jiangella ureilytica TaxID=2530374 RepID=A0A4R4RS23_9ACTN|nr:aminotransferase class V-fold PLP-dependent enzyme [Jiangella ureilytica]TDC51243.1 aminotransferase class V-fold PLP-dependent enzyme [Jiangella ureilytica]
MSTRGVSASSDGYFDAASTEPLHPAAREVLLAAADEGWADPARLYGSARRARMLLDNAREVVAAVVGARPDEVSFTASGTQAIQLGMLGTAAARRREAGDPRVVAVSAVEHSAVLQSAAHLARHEGARTVEVGVDRDGRVDPAAFAAAVADDTVLACLQAANHEVGTVQPVDEVAAHCAGRGVPLLVDAAQAAGRVPLPAGWSVLTASAHKWGGPAGVGVLAVRRNVRWRSPLPGDEREGGRVPGFENVPAALAAAAALRARWEEADAVAARQRELVDHIRARVPELLADVDVVGHPTLRLPHLVTFSCLYVDGEALVTELDRAGFAISSGSSCTSSTLRPSHVLAAMGALTHGNVRVSLTSDATRDDVDRLLVAVADVVTRLRAGLGAL